MTNPKISPTLSSMDSVDLTFIEQIPHWLETHVLTTGTAVQGVLILIALTAGFFVRKFSLPPLHKAIDSTPLKWRTRQALKNITRLSMQVSALIIILIGSIIAASGLFGASFNTALAQAAMSLLLAWVVIRTVLQLVENTALRNLFALMIWTIAALEILGILDETVAALDSVGMDMGDFRLSALTVIKGLLAVFLLLYAAIFTSGMAEKRLTKIKGLTPSSRVLVGKIIRITLISIALLIGITSTGIDLSLFAVFGGAIGLGIGFGLQKVISNLFSGMLLLMDKSIKPGDILELPGNIFGWVEHMGARYTEIVTRDNKSFLIPNEDFVTQQVVNWSHGNTLVRIEVSFGVDYRHNPHEIKDMAEEAAKTPDRVVQDPAPVCHFVEFGDSSLQFKLRFWIEDAEKGVTNMRGAVMLALWDTFKENGIQIPYPQRVVHLHNTESV